MQNWPLQAVNGFDGQAVSVFLCLLVLSLLVGVGAVELIRRYHSILASFKSWKTNMVSKLRSRIEGYGNAMLIAIVAFPSIAVFTFVCLYPPQEVTEKKAPEYLGVAKAFDGTPNKFEIENLLTHEVRVYKFCASVPVDMYAGYILKRLAYIEKGTCQSLDRDDLDWKPVREGDRDFTEFDNFAAQSGIEYKKDGDGRPIIAVNCDPRFNHDTTTKCEGGRAEFRKEIAYAGSVR